MLFIPLTVWKTLFPSTDLAVLALVALAGILFWGSFSVASAVQQARMKFTIRPESKLSSFTSGRIYAGFQSMIFAVIAIFLLAWQFVTATQVEILLYLFLAVAAGSLFWVLEETFNQHLHKPYSRSVSASVSSWIMGVMFLPIISWVNWNYTSHSGLVLTASFTEAVSYSFQALPERRGWIAELLSPLYAFDAAKLWIVVQLEASKWATILLSIDTALISFIMARSAVITNILLQTLHKENLK